MRASVALVLAAASLLVPAPASAHGRKVTLGRTDYGKVLVDGHGRALYLFTREKRGAKPRCYGACASAWPPFLSKARPRAGARVKQSKLGTTRRADGRRQATYAGHPLYYYVGDRKPGQVNCQAAYEYGGGWFVVKRSGSAVR